MRLRSILFLALGLLASAVPAAPPVFPGGNYGGILSANISSDPDNSGILTVVMNNRGSATLKLFWQGQVYSFKSAFTPDNILSRQLGKKGDPDGTKLDLFCSLNPSGRSIGGILTDPTADGGSFNLSGAFPDTTAVEQLTPGLQVAFIDPSGTSGAEIVEDGFSIVTVGKTTQRSTRFAGRLPDGTAYLAGSPLRGTQYALRAGLYAQRKPGSGGQLLGVSDVDTSSVAAPEAGTPQQVGSVAALLASFRWHKKHNLGRVGSYPNGFDQRVDLSSRGYTRDRDLSFVLTGQRNTPRNATLSLSNGNLGTRVDTPGPNPVTVGLSVSFFGAKIVGANPSKVRISVDPRTAKFGGSFKHPDTGETVKFHGAFSAFVGLTPGEGHGNFLSRGLTRDDPANARSGSVRITVN